MPPVAAAALMSEKEVRNVLKSIGLVRPLPAPKRFVYAVEPLPSYPVAPFWNTTLPVTEPVA